MRVAAIHDFGAKLRQPSLLGRLKAYVEWQARLRGTLPPDPGATDLLAPDAAPISINLDLTTACNYACDHCVDMEILNTGIKFEMEKLKSSLDLMWRKGLRSAIIIGGGEPTVLPQFEEIVGFLKDRKIAIGIVTNGSGNRKILEVADRFTEGDWVRLSLDAGSDAIFQAMHKPKKPLTLDQICEGIPPIRERNPALRVGFSFIITWKGARANNTDIVENIHEIGMAAERARRHRFSYISYKPFLERAPENNAEVVGIDDAREEFDDTIRRICAAIDGARELATRDFEVVESTNLRVLEARTYRDLTRQPGVCHKQFFQQVLSPLGIYNCPVYRSVPHAKVGEKHGYADEDSFREVRENLARLLSGFNATEECKKVTCLYNGMNWWIEDLIEHPEKLARLEPSEERNDFFF